MTKLIGFAALSSEERKEIARRGGNAVQKKGTGHTFTNDEARIAGKKGGASTFEKHGSEHYAKLGRKGGSQRRRQLRLPGTR